MGIPVRKSWYLLLAFAVSVGGVRPGFALGAPPGGAVRLPGTGPVPGKSFDVVIIPMHGSFGFEPAASEWIDADAFAALAKQAKSLKPKFVVLDIESPGGMVIVMHAIGETLMKEFPEGCGTVPVAWPGMAGSAASFITLACPKIVVKPGARVGAALTVRHTPKGVVAVDDLPADKSGAAQKFKSFSDALERSVIQYGGHPPEVRAAMATQAASLFWSPSQRKFFSSLPDPKNRGDLQEIDTPVSVLTMTAREMVDYGLAVQADGLEGLKRALGLEPSATAVTLGSELPAWFRAVSEAYRPSIADDQESIQVLVVSFAEGLNDWLRLDREVKLNDAKRKASVTDKDRERDKFEAAGRLLRSERDKAGKKSGVAATELKSIVDRLEKSTRRLKDLGVNPLVLPSSAILAPRLQASLACHGKGDYRGALEILAPSPPPK
jgi:ATP-dependent protease ClpP protease subunit